MELKYFQYSFPFKQPFRTSQSTLNAREGILIQLRRDEITALGEAAPLTGFSNESLDQVRDQLNKHSSEIANLLQEDPGPGKLDSFFEQNDIVPSLCFALDTLACDYQAQKLALPVSRLLFNEPLESIPVNTVIPIRPSSEIISLVQHRINEGYRTFKLKTGKNFTEELSVLKSIRKQFPDVTLRIDANRAWSFEVALKNLVKLEKLGIEYCEEPLDQPSLKALEKLSGSSPVPVALDETLTHPDIIESVAPFVPVLILKPMILGKISNLFATKRIADAHDNTVIFTTTLESGVGRMMTATLASGLGTRHAAHGLATGSFLTVDVWHDGAYINNGNFSLPGNLRQNEKYRSDLQNLAEEILFQN